MYPNDYFFYGFMPFIPSINEKPPTVYTLLESIVNYGKDDKTKIKDLASVGRATIFDFDYPLSDKLTKEEFECMILNHFLMRRIGFETLTAFKIQLNVKLNEIMPMYNKLIDLLYSENGFGEITKRQGFDNRIIDNTSKTINEDTSTTTNSMTNNSETNHSETSDRRESDTPQSQLENVRDGSYVTKYNYDTNTGNSQDTSTTNGNSKNTSNGETNTNSNTKDNNNYEENTIHTNMIELYTKFNQEIKNIYTMIFKDLECLFYQLV